MTVVHSADSVLMGTSAVCLMTRQCQKKIGRMFKMPSGLVLLLDVHFTPDLDTNNAHTNGVEMWFIHPSFRT